MTSCGKTYLEIGVTTSQTLTTSDCTTDIGVQGDAFLVYIPAGTSVRITMQTNPLDALFQVFSPAGGLLREQDSQYLAANEVFTLAAATAGYYKIVASSFALVYPQYPDPGHDFGPYTLSVVIP